MSPLDDLPPDLRATLSLLVDRGKSYAEVADLLGIPESAVRERAHAALDALAGERVATAAPARVGAADEEPAANSSLGSDSASFPTRAPAPPPSSRARRNGAARSGSATLPVSRRGGAIVLAAIAVVIVVVVIVAVAGGGSSSHKGGTPGGASNSASTHSPGASTSTASGKSPQVTNQITLTPPEPGSKAIGIVEILSEGSQHAFYIGAEHLPPSSGFTYVVWLYNSPTSAEAVSKSPNVGSDGRLQGGALLPSNASDFHQILLTRETTERPTTPGPTVLSGTFSLTK
jgi:hypothetical protein